MTLKAKLKELIADIDDRYVDDVEEINEILDNYNDDLSNISLLDRFIIGRLVNDEKISDELDLACVEDIIVGSVINPFDLNPPRKFRTVEEQEAISKDSKNSSHNNWLDADEGHYMMQVDEDFSQN